MATVVAEVECRLRFTYPSEDFAEGVLRAVELENHPYVRARREGEVLLSDASADSVGSLLHTLEDYLANVAVAEKMLGSR